jgi:tripartite-type tricarboxylate transporter receptor subunit TctC
LQTTIARIRVLLAIAATGVLIGLPAGNAAAQPAAPYPSRPVKLVIPFPPGGPLDIIGRAIAQKASEDWGQSVVVDNRPGAGGNIGAGHRREVATGRLHHPDGRAVDARGEPEPLRQDAVRRGEGLRADLARGDHAQRAGRERVAAGRLREGVRRYAKANSGKLSFGSGSNGSAGHLAGELFKVDTGTDIVHVPYKGGAPATQALLAGDTQFMFDNLANAMPQVKAGKLKALAVTTAERSKLAPDLPTMAEAGLPGFDISTWFGLLAPCGNAEGRDREMERRRS